MAEIDRETAQLLAVGAGMAAMLGAKKEADLMIAGLTAARPDDLDAQIMVAIAYRRLKEFDACKRILTEKVLAKEPDWSIAKAQLAWVYHDEGRLRERDELVEQIVAANDDANAVMIANELKAR